MLNLGGLFFTLDADTRGLTRAQQNIRDFAASVDRAFKGLGQGQVSSNFANGLLRQEKSILSMLEKIKGLQDKINSSELGGRAKGNLLKDVTAQYDDFVRKMSTPVPLNAAQFSRTAAQMTNQLKELEREFGVLNSQVSRSKGFANFTGILHGLGGASLLVQGHLGGMSTRFFALTGLVREFGGAAAVTAASVAGLAAGIGLLGTSAIKAGRELQGLQAAYTAVTGSITTANIQLKFAKDVANQAGVAFTDTAKGYMRFLASAQVGGLTLKQTQDAFRGITLAAATMQLSTEDMQGVFRALDQMMSKGTVQAEELRGQLGDRLPGAFQIAAVAMGKTTAELGKLMKDGEVLSADFVPKFVAAVQRMWNIDPSKPINTLTASLNRLSNEWTYFGQALDQATGATRAFKALVEGMISGLQFLSQNMTTIIGLLGAVTGGFIGLGVAMAVNALIQYVVAWGSITTAFQYALVSLRQLVAGILTLNVALMANPALRIVTMLITLTAAIGGAKLGYDLLTSAVNQNNAAMNNTAGIESYISQQQKLGFAVKSTTMEMIRQVEVMNKVSAENAVRAGLEAAKNASPSTMDYTVGAVGTVLTDWGIPGMETSPAALAARRAKAANDEANAAISEARRTANLYNQLQDLMKLPEPPAVGVSPLSKGTGKGKSLSDDIDQIEDYVLRMQRAEARLKELGQGNRDYKLVDDLFKARETLNDLNPKQVAKVDAALRAAGYTSGDLDARLAAVFTRTRQAEEAARTFAQVWDDLDQGVNNLDTLNKKLSLLREGKTDPLGLDNLDSFTRASDMLRKINIDSKAGQDTLRGLQARIAELGVPVANTGDLFGDAANQLAAFFQMESQGEKLVQVFSNLYEETTKAKDKLTELSALTELAGAGGIQRLLGAGSDGKAVSQAVARGQAVRDMVREMRAAGAEQAEINTKATEYLNILRQVDDAEEAYDKVRRGAEQTREYFQGIAEAGTGAFQDLVRGVKSLGDALMDLTNNILDAMWQQFIDLPIKNWLADMDLGAGKKKASGLDTALAGIGGSAANDNGEGGIAALAQAALSASGAINGNFTSSIVNSALQLGTKQAAEVSATASLYALTSAAYAATAALSAAAATAVASSASSTLSSIGSSLFKAALSSSPGMAMGGGMSAGTMYEINEPGVSGEYFIPSVNGYMSPNSPLTSDQNGSIMIDASTTIDARGATREGILELERKMAERDARLMQTLPFLIDSRVQDSSSRRRYK
jgi:tape measure domain-containing protein